MKLAASASSASTVNAPAHANEGERRERERDGERAASAAPATDTLHVSIEGPKYKLGHRYADGATWSYDTGKAPSKDKAMVKALKHALQALPVGCKACTLLNEAGAERCKACGTEVTSDATPSCSPLAKEALLVMATRALAVLPQFVATRTTWKERKTANDRWAVDIHSQWTPAADKYSPEVAAALCAQLDGTEWLIVAEQVAVKLTPSSYDTKMTAHAFLVGASADAASCAIVHAQVLRDLLGALQAASPSKRARGKLVRQPTLPLILPLILKPSFHDSVATKLIEQVSVKVARTAASARKGTKNKAEGAAMVTGTTVDDPLDGGEDSQPLESISTVTKRAKIA